MKEMGRHPGFVNLLALLRYYISLKFDFIILDAKHFCMHGNDNNYLLRI